MDTPLSPSVTETDQYLTEGQIGKICEMIAATLRKERNRFPKGSVQDIIEKHTTQLQKEMASATVTVFENIIVLTSNIITRPVKVNRHRKPQEMIEALGRVQYTEKSVVKIIPMEEGEDKVVEFFKMDQFTSDDKLDQELDRRGLKRDIYAQAAVNEADPTFADTHPNGMSWKDENGNWCYIAFLRPGDERYVDVYRHSFVWLDDWWFGGVRK